jgi:hypothetical protein
VECVRENFGAELLARWSLHIVGAGSIQPSESTALFAIDKASSRSYSNAQIDDYRGLARRRFPWRPPLKLAVRARFSHPENELQGTAGFGFWNDPFLMTERRLPTLPRTLWFFFASTPSDMKLDMDTPGSGWKAAMLDTARPQAVAWAPVAPLMVAMMNISTLYRRLWPRIQRSLGIGEHPVDVDVTKWQEYRLEWGVRNARFSVSDHSGAQRLILERQAPPGPLGFVLWMDNQYLVVTPWGRIRWGTLEVPERQWMEVDKLTINPGRRPGVSRGRR